MSLTITCEDLPEVENRIEVDESRLDKFGMPTASMIYRLGENSLKMTDFGIARAREWLVAAGAQKIAVTPLSKQAGFHLMGTAPMGDCVKTSVTRNDGRVHEFENLTIIDASVFVTSSPVNPTSTLQSLALRAADLMSTRLAAA
jgi:choline dehydrogenase-like flavoprotein